MRHRLLIWILPILLASNRVVSTEIPFELSNQQTYDLQHKAYQSDFRSLPSNPNVYEELQTYQDKNLTLPAGKIKPHQAIQFVNLFVNDDLQQVFELANGQYVVADKQVIYDDIILHSEEVEQTYWLKKGFTLYSSPIGNQQKRVQSDIKAYQAVAVSEIVETELGSFAHVKGKGWVKLSELSIEDNRITAVQELLDSKYTSERFSIYVKQLSTQEVAGVNKDKKMYAASVSKLPILYYSQMQVNQGKYNLEEGLHYVEQVTDFKGAYSAEGSGSLSKQADNVHYKIRDLIDRTAKLSDNSASNLLAYYMTNRFDEEYNKVITAITGEPWDMSSRLASAQMAGLMMEELYHQGGYVLTSLSATQFDDQRIARDIPVPVAHKIGDAYDFRHDVAVVYTDSPFVLSIFTESSDYETISTIAREIYGILR